MYWIPFLMMGKKHHLFTLDTHSVRSVSVQKGKKIFAAIKLSAAKNFFAWKTLQLDTASITNTLAVDDLRNMCPAGFNIHSLIKPSSAVLRTYGGGLLKPVGQIELVCETRGKHHTLQFQLLNKDAMGSQPPLLSASDCVRLGLIEIGGNTCSLDRNNPKGGASQVCQLDPNPQRGRVEESGTPDQEVRPASLNGSTTELSPINTVFILSSPPQSLLLYIIFAVSRRDSLSGSNFIFHRLHDLPLSHIVYRHECNPRLDRRIISVN